MTFLDKLHNIITKNNSLLCVGLDPDVNKIPKHLLQEEDPFFAFNKALIEATHEAVCCYKPQMAYYAAQGLKGLKSLEQTIDYIHATYPDIPVILDGKRGDIGSTAEKYTEEVFDWFEAEAVTVNPYLGFDSLEPFLKKSDKGVIILCRTSNNSASDFQDLEVNGTPLFVEVAKKVNEWHQKYGNCLLVVGATWPEQVKKIREVAPELFFLVPGIGAQGGDLEQTMHNGLRTDKSGLIINSSRSIIYAGSGEDFAEKANEETIKLRDEINKYR